MVTFKQLVKYKTSLGKAESVREFGNWYQDKWKRDYPMAYAQRFGKRRLMVTGRSKRRVRQYKRAKNFRASKSKSAAFSRANIGKRVGEATAKRHEVLKDWALTSTRTLAQIPLLSIAQTQATNINLRDRQIINLRGVKLHFDFQCLGAVYQYVNMAVIAPKDTTVVDTEDFFRDGSLGNQTRYKDFANDLSSMQFAYLGINTDKYTVLLHKRWHVNTRIESATVNRGIGGNDWRTYKRYIKINRQISYNSATTLGCNDPIFAVMWTDQAGAPQNATPVQDAITWGFYSCTYFKEPKN